ncbi:MAG: DNA cytosine methyltransferase [Gemmatimonadales bacterium]|nr:DNA cytosine methyltransferase [Gemmatimonadales bacterium]
MVDLFAGCGGLSLGLEQAGFETLAFCEVNKDAADTFAVNRQRTELLRFGDVITELDDRTLEGLRQRWGGKRDSGIDLVCGGPPCQGYSGIGHRRSYAVERKEIPSNHLYLEMIRVIRALRPKAFLFENVRGLMTGRWSKDGTPGEIWRDVLAAFQGIDGYVARPALVQAKQYGVPQNRPRVLIVGFRRDVGMDAPVDADAVSAGFLPGPSGSAPDLEEVWSDIVDDTYPKVLQTSHYPAPARSEFARAMRTRPDGSIAHKGDPLSEHEYSNHSPRIKAKFRAMHRSGGEIPPEFQTKKFAQRLLQAQWGPEGPNITATSLPDDFVHYAQPRTLTVREWARLQCFPDWYQFMGPRTTGGLRRAGKPTEGLWDREVPKYTQIGNAVPVRLAQAVGEHIAKILR